jgi:hypothetical protein
VIFSRLLPYEEISKRLSKDSKIVIISCNGCARMSGSGGLERAEELRLRLMKEGYKVTDEAVIPYACSEPYLRELRRMARLSPEADTIISLACSAGWSCIKRSFPNMKVINATEDIGLMIIDMDEGLFKVTSPFKKYEEILGRKYEIYSGKPIQGDNSMEV